MTDWRTVLYFEEEKLKYNDSGNSTKLTLSEGGHMLMNLERVGEWTDEDSVYLVKEKNGTMRKAINKIHRILNHKKMEQMEYAFRNAWKLNTETRRLTKEVVENCEICKQNER